MKALIEQVLAQIHSCCRNTNQQMKRAKGIQDRWLHNTVKSVLVCACHTFGGFFFAVSCPDQCRQEIPCGSSQHFVLYQLQGFGRK